MEDENKKERKGMKRTHNDAVRELVAFVRKRDKRLAAHQAEEAKRRMEREAEDKLRFVRVSCACWILPCTHVWFIHKCRIRVVIFALARKLWQKEMSELNTA